MGIHYNIIPVTTGDFTHTLHNYEVLPEYTKNTRPYIMTYNLAQRAYISADQNMLDNLIVERFREGHGNEELKKHLCLYPSTGLQDLIAACVRFEMHVEIGSRAHKSNEGLYTVQGSNQAELTLSRGHARPNAGPSRNQNGGEPQQGSRFNQNRNSGARIYVARIYVARIYVARVYVVAR